MKKSIKFDPRSERDFCLVRSFYRGKTSLTNPPYTSEQEARASYHNLATESPELESSLSDHSNKLSLTLNKFYNVIGKYIQTRPRPLTEDGERKRDFNMVREMYRTLSKDLGLEGTEQFLRFYYPNLDHLNPDQGRQALKYLNYAVKGLNFQDFLIDRGLGKDQMIKSEIGPHFDPKFDLTKVLKQ